MKSRTKRAKILIITAQATACSAIIAGAAIGITYACSKKKENQETYSEILSIIPKNSIFLSKDKGFEFNSDKERAKISFQVKVSTNSKEFDNSRLKLVYKYFDQKGGEKTIKFLSKQKFDHKTNVENVDYLFEPHQFETKDGDEIKILPNTTYRFEKLISANDESKFFNLSDSQSATNEFNFNIKAKNATFIKIKENSISEDLFVIQIENPNRNFLDNTEFTVEMIDETKKISKLSGIAQNNGTEIIVKLDPNSGLLFGNKIKVKAIEQNKIQNKDYEKVLFNPISETWEDKINSFGIELPKFKTTILNLKDKYNEKENQDGFEFDVAIGYDKLKISDTTLNSLVNKNEFEIVVELLNKSFNNEKIEKKFNNLKLETLDEKTLVFKGLKLNDFPFNNEFKLASLTIKDKDSIIKEQPINDLSGNLEFKIEARPVKLIWNKNNENDQPNKSDHEKIGLSIKVANNESIKEHDNKDLDIIKDEDNIEFILEKIDDSTKTYSKILKYKEVKEFNNTNPNLIFEGLESSTKYKLTKAHLNPNSNDIKIEVPMGDEAIEFETKAEKYLVNLEIKKTDDYSVQRDIDLKFNSLGSKWGENSEGKKKKFRLIFSTLMKTDNDKNKEIIFESSPKLVEWNNQKQDFETEKLFSSKVNFFTDFNNEENVEKYANKEYSLKSIQIADENSDNFIDIESEHITGDKKIKIDPLPIGNIHFEKVDKISKLGTKYSFYFRYNDNFNFQISKGARMQIEINGDGFTKTQDEWNTVNGEIIEDGLIKLDLESLVTGKEYKFGKVIMPEEAVSENHLLSEIKFSNIVKSGASKENYSFTVPNEEKFIKLESISFNKDTPGKIDSLKMKYSGNDLTNKEIALSFKSKANFTLHTNKIYWNNLKIVNDEVEIRDLQIQGAQFNNEFTFEDLIFGERNSDLDTFKKFNDEFAKKDPAKYVNNIPDNQKIGIYRALESSLIIIGESIEKTNNSLSFVMRVANKNSESSGNYHNNFITERDIDFLVTLVQIDNGGKEIPNAFARQNGRLNPDSSSNQIKVQFSNLISGAKYRVKSIEMKSVQKNDHEAIPFTEYPKISYKGVLSEDTDIQLNKS